MNEANLELINELIQRIEPWVTLLEAQTQGDDELRQAFFAEFTSATADFAQLAQKAGLRGLSNVSVLLARGLQDRKSRPVDDDDAAQITLWLAGVQSYLSAELTDVLPLVQDLLAIRWVPRLAPAAIDALEARLVEPIVDLIAAAQQRAAELDTDVSIDQSMVVDIDVDTQVQANEGLWQADAANLTETSTPASEDAFALLGTDDDAFGDFTLGEEADALGAVDPLAAQTDALAQIDQAASEHDYANGSLLSTSDAAGDIWIAPEEFQLVTETVQARLQPALADLLTANDGNRSYLYGEAVYQIELLGNAFGVLQLESAQGMCQSLTERLHSFDAADGMQVDRNAKALQRWVQLMVDYCSKPDQSSSYQRVVQCVSAADWLMPLSAAQSANLLAEFARVHVGKDPSLMAERKTEMSADDMNLAPADDVMPNVLQGMLMELPDNAQNLSESVSAFIATGDAEHIDDARRVAHTLKGDANTVGIRGIANLTHELEDIFIELAKNPGVPSPAFATLLTEASDCVSEMADFVLGRGMAPANAQEVAQRVLDVANQLTSGTAASELVVSEEEFAEQETALEVAQRLAEIAAATPAAAPTGTAGPAADVPMLQIPADVLDRLLDFSSEALVLLRQIENQIKSVDEGQAEIERQRQEGAHLLEELDRSVSLRGSALQSSRQRGEDVDPLELDQYNELYTVTRRLIEVSADEQTARNTIERAARRLLDLANEQEKVQLELQDQIMRTRQVPVREFIGRFQRAVRQTSKMLDKEVEFNITGQDTLIDRVQMENLIDPLMHSLRNSIDHGIEGQSLRMTRGKSPSGKVNLSFERDGRSVSVKIKDDGAGLNYDRIRAKAIERGFMSDQDQVSNEDLAQIILLPGFSTKEEVTQVSGRGIGLDVVYQRIQDLRGSLLISSQATQGTTVDIRLPASMTSLYVALAQNQRGTFAIATDSVESFALLEPDQFSIVGTQLYVTTDEGRMPVSDLEALVQGYRGEAKIPEKPMVGALMKGLSGELQVGMVSEVREMRTVIVKDFGPFMRAFPGVRGGTILGDGAVAPVIDARELMRNTAYQPWSERDESYRAQIAQQIRYKVLIADDSLSVRRALEQLMRDNGFDVLLARDGLEALALIKATKPDVMLLDLEMPRMNGLELTSFARKEMNYADVPIIMITSRTSEKHRQLAVDAGVNEVLSKPYSEDTLVKMVQDYLKPVTQN
jgi:chemotaxis protein histidine kinase CheA/ActR/RegA family two-component response regulator